MSIYIGIVVAIMNAAIYLKESKKGLILYILLSYCVPLSAPGNAKVSYEILGFIGIMFVWILKICRHEFILKKYYICPMIYMIIYSIATILSALVHHCTVQWTVLSGAFRMVCLFVIFTQETWQTKLWEYLLRIIVLWNTAAVFIQVLFPASFDFFSVYYIKNETWMRRLFTLTWGHKYARAFGMTSTPSILSYLCTIGTVFFLCKCIDRDSKIRDYVFFTFTLICGISTATKAFFLGTLVCFLVLAVCILFFTKKDGRSYLFWTKEKTRASGMIILAVCLAGYFFDARGIMVSGYLKKSTDIVTALETRYDLGIPDQEDESRDSPQTAMKQVQVLNPFEILIGVGATTPYGEAVQDSEWFMIIHNTGIAGLAAVMLWIGRLVIVSFKKRDIEMILYEIMIFLLALVINSIFQFTGIVLVSYIHCINDGSMVRKEDLKAVSR